MLNVAIISHFAEECRFSLFQVSTLLTPALETAGAVRACLCMGGGDWGGGRGRPVDTLRKGP